MKSRLSSTIWTLVLVNGLVLFGVLWLAYNAGRLSNGASMLDFGSLPSGASGSVIFALFLVLGAIVFLAWRLNSSFVAPVQELAQFSERFATGDPRARAEVNSNDELGYIAENLNRAVARVSKATSNQEASDHLQRSITELLTVINQVARGDLTLRGKVTNDALGNVADSINYMLDNFTKVLERVRKAAMEVTACSNNILVAADQMQAGATQQDQEITNTSSAGLLLGGGDQDVVGARGDFHGGFAHAFENLGEVVEHVVDGVRDVAEGVVGDLAAERQVAAGHLVDDGEQLGDAALEMIAGFLVAGGLRDASDSAIEIFRDVAELIVGADLRASTGIADGEALGELREILHRCDERAIQSPAKEQYCADGQHHSEQHRAARTTRQ